MVCLEEMEQARGAKDPVREEVWEAAVVREPVVEEDEAAFPAQVWEEIVSARTVGKRWHIRQVCPVTISIARNVEPR